MRMSSKDHVRLVLLGDAQGVFAVGRLADDLDVGPGQQAGQTRCE